MEGLNERDSNGRITKGRGVGSAFARASDVRGKKF